MKTNLDQLFKTSSSLEENGVDFVISDTVSFRVRPFKSTNPRVKAAMARHYKPFARQVEMGTLDQQKQFELNVEIFLDVCFVSWTGVEIDGKLAEPTRENAKAFFLALPDLFDTLWKHANDFNNYREDLGNS